MSVLLIRCPKTKVAISTGIKTDMSSFNSSPVFFGCTHCPVCGVNHDWFAGDAWLYEEPDQLNLSNNRRNGVHHVF
jgi:hypothetical protein